MATAQSRIFDAGVFGDAGTVYAVQLSTISPEEAIDVVTGQSATKAVNPHHITWEVVTRATTGSPVVQVTHETASDVAASGTARVRVSTVPGGDLTGAVVRVYFHYVAESAGGTSA